MFLVGIQRHFIGKSAEEFLDYMAESVCENLDRISLMCHLVRFRCVSEYCSNKLHILQHIGGILQDYILDPEENRHAQELLIDFASSAVFYSVTHHQDVFYRQVEEIKEKASRLSFHSVVHSLDP